MESKVPATATETVPGIVEITDTSKLEATIDRLNLAGFTTAARVLPEKLTLAARVARAYEHYRYVSEDKVQRLVERFNAHVLEWKCGYGNGPTPGHEHSRARCPAELDSLKFQGMADYPSVPPDHVVQAVIDAKKEEIFDTFEVASTERRLDPDPIVFGRIAGIKDRFYIAEWGDDVSITDFLETHEG